LDGSPVATWRLPKNPVPTSGVGEVGDEYKAFWINADALIHGRWSRISLNSVVFFEDLTTFGVWQDGRRISIAYVFRFPDFNGGFWEGPGSSPTFTTGQYGFGQNSGGEAIGRSVTITDTAVPEPETWAMLIFGFGMVGTMARYRRIVVGLT
jgi:hypothetical protein